MYGVLWSIVVNSDEPIVGNIDAATIDQRLADRNITGLHLYDGASHVAMQVAYPWIKKLIAAAADTPVITDAAHVFLDEIDLNS